MTPTMTPYEFGDVVLVPFPFTDQTAAKKRPAVVISSRAYQREHPDVIIIAVTSQARPPGLLGEASITEWQAAGLIKPSVIKPVVATVERGLIVRRLGRLADTDQVALRHALREILET